MTMTMKKTVLITALAIMMAMCSTTKTSKNGSTSKSSDAKVQYKDDFRAAGDKEKATLLKNLKATDAKYSVLIFTKNFKGEKIVVSNASSTLYSENLISNLKSGIASTIRIDNTQDTKVYDNFTKKEAIIETKEAQKHKFIYVMKNPGADNPFVITYSNTLRPLEL